ncbi:MAG: DUF1844 domain-containing protein [Acidobacterium ailaaui]|nr:DUF1844 domain-containing protein [Pseudacidobacterium ailaaui]MDI3254535.1 DUF1844 domain-containing protein [Bacillota bacterium]
MDEKQPAFTVTDRRKFTAEGELKPEQQDRPAETSARVITMPAPKQDPAPAPETLSEPQTGPTAQESAEQHAAYQKSTREIDHMLRQANPDLDAPQEVTFEHVIQSIYLSALVAMGAGTEPGQKARIDILGARQSIDMLAVLEQKSQGNLTEKELRLLQNALFDLRMMYVEITNAISKSAQQPPPGRK